MHGCVPNWSRGSFLANMAAMHVDRSRFLLLTAALATAACNRDAAEPKPDEAKAAKDAKALEEAKAGDAKAPAADPGAATKTDAPSTPGTATPPGGGGTTSAPTPVDEAPAPSPVVESPANWD